MPALRVAAPLLLAVLSGCRGGETEVSLVELPGAYRVSSISRDGAVIDGVFGLRSEATRSPVVQGAEGELALADSVVGTFRLQGQLRLAGQATSPARMSGRIDFARVTPAVYRGLFDPELPYRLTGRATITYSGLRRTHAITGTGHIAPPQRVSVVFTDDSGAELVKLDSAHLDAAPSDHVPVGVAITLTAVNPLHFPIRVEAASYRLRIAGGEFLSGQSRRPFVMAPGYNSFRFTTTVKPVRGVVELARRFAAGQDLGVAASGQVTLEESGRRLTLVMEKP